jgi:uncharacterized protein YbjT (DUF2867 family)
MADLPPLSPNGTKARVVALVGATGLVGRAILEGLLADASVTRIHALGRRDPGLAHPKLTPHLVDFSALPMLPPLDEVYLALGTTIKAAGSRAAFRAVDFEANLAAARAALTAGARRAGLVSAMGADAKSRIFYNRVKGELEEALARLSFEALVIARPSLLVGDREALGQPKLGDREALGQPKRLAERVATVVSKLLGRLIPANYRPIAATDVARALLAHVPAARGRVVLLSGEMQG